MTHPFTLEYMQEGETSSNQINLYIKNRKGNEKELVGKPKPSTSICESDSVIARCQTAQVKENPDADLETIREEMNITITDEEKLSFSKILRMAMTRRLEVFAEGVSIVGMSYLAKSSTYNVGSIIRKVMWTLLLLFGTGFMVFQIYDRISYYHTYPTVVDYRVAYNRSLRFPTVTICSEYVLSREAISSLGNQINYYFDRDLLAILLHVSSTILRE